MERTVSVRFDRNIMGPPLKPVCSFRLVGPKCPLPFDKIVIPSSALLYPAYTNNNQTRGGLGQVCVTGMYLSVGHVKFPKFQTGIFVEWKSPLNSQLRLETIFWPIGSKAFVIFFLRLVC